MPSRILSATSGCAANASSMAASSAPSSETTCESSRSNDFVRGALSCDHAFDHLSCQFVIERALVDQSDHARTLPPGVMATSGRSIELLVGDAGDLPVHHFRAHCLVGAEAMVASTKSRPPALTNDCMSCSLMPHSSRSRWRRCSGGSGSVPRNCVDPSSAGGHGNQIRLREVAVVLRLLLDPTRRGAAVVLVEVTGLLNDRAAGREHGCLPTDLVLDARSTERIELTFLVSVRVPSFGDPLGLRERLASTRIDPWCMCASETQRNDQFAQLMSHTPARRPG